MILPGFRLALALLRIPRLFISLLLFPLILSLMLMTAQLIGTTIILSQITRTPEDMQKHVKTLQENSFLRKLVYGSGARLAAIEVCRWQGFSDEHGAVFELPPQTNTCMPDRLDVALHVKNPDEIDVTQYVELFNGNFERLHICQQDCKPDIVLHPEERPPRVNIYSLIGLLLVNQLSFDSPIEQEALTVFEKRYEFFRLLGTQFFMARGYEDPVQLSNISFEVSLLVSISSIIIIGLWLAVKAHRKVLDYFAKSGALFPMVAALGKSEFYSAIWIVTLLRVLTFLLATIPPTYFLFSSVGESEQWGGIFQKDIGHMILWIAALTSTFSLAALISSLADLKHRVYVFSFAYRFIPLMLAALGGAFWLFSFFFGESGIILRHIIASLPIVSIIPIIIAPIFQPPLDIIAVNTLLTLILITALLRSNTRWFAAHLEAL